MTAIRPGVKLRYGRVNEPIRVPIDVLLVDPPGTTYLTSDTAAFSTSLTVKNTTGFVGAFPALVGDPGNDGAEIVRITGVSGSGLTVNGTTLYFPHSASTPVRVLYYDQVVFAYAATLTGAKSTLTTVGIIADQLSTNYNDTSKANGYYFTRFKDSVSGIVSPYSDPIPYGAYALSTARYAIDNALNEINKLDSTVLTDEYAFQQLNNCQTETLRELKRWSWMQSYDQVIGQITTGSWKVAVPSDLDDQNTNKSVNSLRIGSQVDLTWVDKDQFNQFMNGVAYTTLSTAITLGATSMVLTDSSDFDKSGVVTIGTETYTTDPTSLDSVTVANGGTGYSVGDVLTLATGTSGTVTVSAASGGVVTAVNITTIGTGYSEATYATTGGGGSGCTITVDGLTANNLTTNTLTIEAAQVTAAVGDDVFQGATSGLPQYWTTYGGYIYYYPITGATYNAHNIYMDYYKAQTLIVKDSDTLVIPDTTLVQYYLQWKFLKRLNNGVENEGSTGNMNQYLMRRERLKQKEVLGKTFRLKPRYNNWAKQSSFGIDNTSRDVRDGNFPNTGF